MFRPLAFDFPEDETARGVEDQLLLGNELMIAPVYTQNATGRYVYLPEEMMLVKFMPDGSLYQEIMPKGYHFVEVALNEVPLFIRKDKCIPLAKTAQSTAELNWNSVEYIGYEGAKYSIYTD